MTAKFQYRELLDKGIEFETCGMHDIAKKIFISFAKGNATFTMGDKTHDALQLVYGDKAYCDMDSSTKAIEYTYIALCAKKLLLDLQAGFGNSWTFVSERKSVTESVNSFCDWLSHSRENKFCLQEDSRRIMVAAAALKKERNIHVHVSNRETLKNISLIRP